MAANAENPIQQALAALKRMVCKCDGDPFEDCDYVTVATALQLAAQEAEAWEAIESWCHDKSHLVTYERAPMLHWVHCQVHPLGNPVLMKSFNASTRLAAISKAAEFCRKELSK